MLVIDDYGRLMHSPPSLLFGDKPSVTDYLIWPNAEKLPGAQILSDKLWEAINLMITIVSYIIAQIPIFILHYTYKMIELCKFVVLFIGEDCFNHYMSLFCQLAMNTLLCCACISIFTCLMESLSIYSFILYRVKYSPPNIVVFYVAMLKHIIMNHGS